MTKVFDRVLRHKLARQVVPFKEVKTEKITTNPDWVNQNTRWGAHYVLSENGLEPLLPLSHRASLEKDYDNDVLVIAILGEVPEEEVKKATDSLTAEHVKAKEETSSIQQKRK